MGQSKDPLDKHLDEEHLEAMGQESDKKAAKWVKEVGKEKVKEEEKAQDDAMEKLDDAKNSMGLYKERLLEEMKREMEIWRDDMPPGFNWLAQYTSKGLVLYFRNPQHEYFARGLTISGEPKYDINGVARLIVTAMQEIQKQIPEEIPQDKIIVPYK